MKTFALQIAGASLILLLAAGAVTAAAPGLAAPMTTGPSAAAPTVTSAPAQASGPIATILGLSDAQVRELRQQGLSLAQIAERQKVDPQRLVDALVAQWSARIDVRLAAGAITADEANTLRANLAVQAKAMVYQVTIGGMRGAAVGAGPNAANRGADQGNGARQGAGARRGGMMGGPAAGNGQCPRASAAPSS